jgi:transcriptional regulator with XRE-family HTH domain
VWAVVAHPALRALASNGRCEHRELRVQQGMTQQALALTSGVTRNVLIAVEQGKRGLLYERLFDIAEALQVSVAALFEGSADTG